MDASTFRLLADPLYGLVALDTFLAQLISQPELHRLRNVRLSNINSFLLPGGANISRFEHSVGTAILASRAASILGLGRADRRRLECAALLHDVAITPFGHLMEEGFRVAGRPFNHETRLQEIFVDRAELGNVDRQIFRGRAAGFRAVLELSEFRRDGITPSDVFRIMQGDGVLGRLVRGTIDLDNIDNVCRMAYHIGIPFRKRLPLEIVDGFLIQADTLCFDVDSAGLLQDWLDLRARLYNCLMTNPVDFSAKAMLIEAVRLAIVGTAGTPPVINEDCWSFTDGDLLAALAAYGPSSSLVARWEVGDYFDVVGLYWIDTPAGSIRLNCEVVGDLREKIANVLGVPFSDVLLYCIRDKRHRRIDGLPLRSRRGLPTAVDRPLGHDSAKVLFGVLTGRRGGGSQRQADQCEVVLQDMFGASAVSECDPRRHLEDAFESAVDDAQLTLF